MCASTASIRTCPATKETMNIIDSLLSKADTTTSNDPAEFMNSSSQKADKGSKLRTKGSSTIITDHSLKITRSTDKSSYVRGKMHA